MSIFFTLCKKHSSCSSCDNLVSVKRDYADITKDSRLLTLVGCTKGLGCILNDKSTVSVTYLSYLIYLTRSSVEMSNYYHLYIRIDLECLLKGFRVHVPGVVLCIDKYRFSALVCNRVYCRIKGHIGAEDFFALQHSVSYLCLAVELLTRKSYCKMKSRCSRSKTYCALATDLLGNHVLYCINIGTYSRKPVGIVGFLHIFHFISVCCGRCEIKLLFKGFNFH